MDLPGQSTFGLLVDELDVCMPADTIGYVRAALDAVAPGTPTLLPYGWD